MLGRRSIDEVIDHAGAFVDAVSDVTGVIVDLGAGGGVPGLVIATARPDLRLVLVDRRATRTDHLRRLVGRLGMSDRIEVVTADATTLADLRGRRRRRPWVRCAGRHLGGGDRRSCAPAR